MSTDLETRLREAFDARAATTETSPDAWARINRRANRHDHRRSMVLKSAAAAAAVIVALIIGGAVAIFRGNDNSTTVATSKSDETAGRASTPSASSGSVPAISPLLQHNADGSISMFYRSVVAGPARPGEIRTATSGDTLFGIVPHRAMTIRITYVPDTTARGSDLVGVGVLATSEVRTFVFELPAGARVARIEALDAAGLVIATKEES